MARETSGGRQGRTVYLPPELWRQLEQYADGQAKHPAYQGHEIRHGSVSSVIERILSWDAPAAIRQAEARATAAEKQLTVVTRLRGTAAAIINQVQGMTKDLVAELTRVRDLDV